MNVFHEDIEGVKVVCLFGVLVGRRYSDPRGAPGLRVSGFGRASLYTSYYVVNFVD